MASTASDSLPSSPAAPSSAFLDEHHRLCFSSSASTFLDPDPASSFPATAAQQPHPPPPLPAAAARKPPRKRPRASRRPPTTVLTTDASNFRAMVQEFTGFPAPPFEHHHLAPGVLFGAGPSPSGFPAANAPFQLLRPSPLKLAAAPHASAHTCTTNNTSSFAQSLFANSSNVNPNNAADVALSSRSEFYSGFAQPLAGAPTAPSYDDGFQAAEGERVERRHGLVSSFLHAGDRYHSHH